jgi:hypothetical protein
LFSFLSLAIFALDTNWTKVKENDGIVIYTRELKGLGVKQVKAEMVLRTSLSSLVALVKRGDLYVDWSYQCTESYLLGEINDSIQFGYTKLDVPWPVHDRDIVYKLKISQNKETGVVRTFSHSVPNYISTKKGVVRVLHATTQWTFKPSGNGYVEMEYIAGFDPGGSAPAWIVNMGLDIGPMHNLSRIKEVIRKDCYQNAKFEFISEYNRK